MEIYMLENRQSRIDGDEYSSFMDHTIVQGQKSVNLEWPIMVNFDVCRFEDDRGHCVTVREYHGG